MKTLKGFEAIAIATDHQAKVYDVYSNHLVSVQEAKQFIDTQRDPQSFVLRNWPDSDAEAEEFVVHLFELAIAERQLLMARVVDLSDAFDEDEPLNQQAAELAAKRLAADHRLQIVELHREGNVYKLPATIYLTDDFLNQLRGVVCEECANLDIEGPFHKACLTALVGYLENTNLRLKDITKVQFTEPESSLLQMMQRRVPVQLLNKTVAEAKSRWQTVLKPMFQREKTEQHPLTDDGPLRVHQPRTNSDKAPGVRSSTSDASGQARASVESATTGMAQGMRMETDRPRLTKEQLISYLNQVEIVDETGEVRELRSEQAALVQQLAVKDQELLHLERERAFMERQCEEMKRDLDTLIEAMQIAKRHGRDTSNVVDVMEEETGHR